MSDLTLPRQLNVDNSPADPPVFTLESAAVFSGQRDWLRRFISIELSIASIQSVLIRRIGRSNRCAKEVVHERLVPICILRKIILGLKCWSCNRGMGIIRGE